MGGGCRTSRPPFQASNAFFHAIAVVQGDAQEHGWACTEAGVEFAQKCKGLHGQDHQRAQGGKDAEKQNADVLEFPGAGRKTADEVHAACCHDIDEQWFEPIRGIVGMPDDHADNIDQTHQAQRDDLSPLAAVEGVKKCPEFTLHAGFSFRGMASL